MVMDDLKVFKLNYAGEIEEINAENLIDLFSLYDVLAFYTSGQKRLYIWIGEYALNSIKKYIAQFRQIFANEYPDYRVLRYITIESKTEPFDFFQNTGIPKNKLHEKIESEQLKYSEHEEIFSKINDLKNDADKAFENEDYSKAIELSEEIIELAIKINDENIIKNQKEFMAEAEARQKARDILKEIRQEKTRLRQKINNISKDEEIIEIYNEAAEFRKKYNDYLNLPALASVVKVLNEIEQKYNEYTGKERKKEKESDKSRDLIIKISELRNKAIEALEIGKLISSYNYFKEIIQYLDKIEE
ncbi:MAG: hypothetical protein ACP6IY_06275 [Promethearchaeia archaeon]